MVALPPIVNIFTTLPWSGVVSSFRRLGMMTIEDKEDRFELLYHLALFISKPSLPEVNTNALFRGLPVRLNRATIRTSVLVDSALTGDLIA
ncbi:hypothetical protein FNV43_RR05801 [Rhamnella rubrinervis]|uniref:Uncharacterized protein n=1 Tax=Rhamnella rubrinervis TaxID=2594499 RepID=A0A8K0HMR4_9ROSA|nr:hypothetical protein FNV43_RR05801 [Rhamnella rubrinervis]